MRQGKLINIKNSKSELNHAASVYLPKARACTLSLEFISQTLVILQQHFNFTIKQLQ